MNIESFTLKPSKDHLYHYTTHDKLRSIFKDKYLKRFKYYSNQPNEKPVVWFSSNSVFENSCSKRVFAVDTQTGVNKLIKTLNHEEMFQHSILSVRFVVSMRDVTVFDWECYRKLCGVDEELVTETHVKARNMQARPYFHWYASFKDVKDDKWLDIQAWNGSAWETLH